MTIIRHYVMKAAEGRQDELRTALTRLADQIIGLEGSERADVFGDSKDPSTFIFLEHWSSADAYQAASSLLGKAAFGPIMATLAQPPEARHLIPADSLHDSEC